jgi:hypothetical protein
MSIFSERTEGTIRLTKVRGAMLGLALATCWGGSMGGCLACGVRSGGCALWCRRVGAWAVDPLRKSP